MGRRIERHPGLMLAARMTLAHFSVSAARKRPNSAGVIGIGTPPSSTMRALSLGSASAAPTALLGLSTIPLGVAAGAPMPAKALVSKPGRKSPIGGTRTTPYGESLGTLEVGKGADMVLIDWDKVAYPYLDELTPTLDAVVQRAKNDAVTMTMCDGEVIYKDGKFTKVDRTVALKALHDDLSKALSDDEVERRHLSKALLPHVRKFYAGYIDTSKHEPFYRPSSMV